MNENVNVSSNTYYENSNFTGGNPNQNYFNNLNYQNYEKYQGYNNTISENYTESLNDSNAERVNLYKEYATDESSLDNRK